MGLTLKKLGFEDYEGVIAAYIPAGEITKEHEIGDAIVFDSYGHAVDMLRITGQPVKWWAVKQAARQLGLTYPEPVFHGPACEFSVQCFSRKIEGRVPAVRGYARGPWIKLTEADLAGD